MANDSGFHSELPVTQAVDVADPQAAARALAHLPYPFLLHSSPGSERARWSFFGADPFAVFRGDHYDDAVRLWRHLSDQVLEGDPTPTLVPFTGGAVGYWAYDFGRRLERLPEMARDDLHLPDVLLGFYDVIGAYDHVTRQAWLFSSGLPLEESSMRRARAEQRLDQFLLAFGSAPPAFGRLPQPRVEITRPRSTFTPEGYRRAVDAVREHIRAGDIFQANLSQRWTLDLESAEIHTTAFALYDALSRFSPAPFSGLFVAPDHAVVSSSPERFVELRGARIETRPIKGTRPRSSDPLEDQHLRRELIESAKDQAENIMIVDVLRNDLGRVSLTGSIEATRLCEVETFPHVHHLVSTITGELREDLDAFDLLHACFPGGSITGAPKIRAMEILERLEPVRRHVYTGCLGYVDFRGDADWNIAIRTALVTRGAIHFAAGGGITAESDPRAEYLETLIKAEGMRQALERLVGPVSLEPALTETR
jgi:para-aminobenzoate synthetase component 1